MHSHFSRWLGRPHGRARRLQHANPRRPRPPPLPPSSPSPSSSATGCQPFSLSAFQSVNLSAVSQRPHPQSLPQSRIPSLLLATNLTSLFLIIPTAFALPVVGDESLVPATAARFDTPLGQNLTLLAAEIHTEHAQPEGIIPLTLYWRADSVPSTRPELVVELFGRDQQLLGKLQSWHGGGLYPADFWPSGQVVVEETAVRLPATGMDLPVLAPVVIKLAGGEATVTIGRVAIEPTHYPPPNPDILAEWEGVQLVSAEIVQGAEAIQVQLVWQVTADFQTDYTTFLHLGEQGTPPLATGDNIPRGGLWPTSHWRTGQQFSDWYTIPLPETLPDGRYPLTLGFYHPEPPYPRLPLLGGGDGFVIGEVEK
ncbi:MAG: hypothetical protein IPL28_03170 [Chloroflexi bacterium]|nr:hypothetical protein [Chloroflexota bacterium]